MRTCLLILGIVRVKRNLQTLGVNQNDTLVAHHKVLGCASLYIMPTQERLQLERQGTGSSLGVTKLGFQSSIV